MTFKRIYINILPFIIFLLFIYLITVETLSIFAVIYAIISIILVVQMWLSKNDLSTKIILTLVYVLIMAAQQIFNVLIVFSGDQTGILFVTKKFIAVLLMLLPFFILYLNYLYTLNNQFFPSLRDGTAISFEIIKKAQNSATVLKDTILKSKSSLRVENLTEIANDIPRHSYTKYLNKNNLSDEFFEECEKSLEDEHLYIIVSSTGSSASELISVFTQKTYNHVSLSFDSELRTILSYNGGENVYPPGLNKEQLESFHKKEDASIMVYSLAASKEKKQHIIDKIKEINEKGSAYNLVGLVTKISIRPNIMFCSQFVYNILKSAGIEYFNSSPSNVKPTDFIEKDFYRKLNFCYEIKLKDLL